MSGKFVYCNTDLDLTSPEDLTRLAQVFERQAVCPLQIAQAESGLWCATFETEQQYDEPEPNIAALLTVVEAFDPFIRDIWFGCTIREFNIGYDCGSKPWAFNQGLSSQLLGRMAAAKTSLRVTLYPEHALNTESCG